MYSPVVQRIQYNWVWTSYSILRLNTQRNVSALQPAPATLLYQVSPSTVERTRISTQVAIEFIQTSRSLKFLRGATREKVKKPLTPESNSYSTYIILVQVSSFLQQRCEHIRSSLVRNRFPRIVVKLQVIHQTCLARLPTKQGPC